MVTILAYMVIYFGSFVNNVLCLQWVCHYNLQQNVSFTILSALLTEFSTGAKSSSVGFSWEMHLKCKLAFEVGFYICFFIDNFVILMMHYTLDNYLLFRVFVLFF